MASSNFVEQKATCEDIHEWRRKYHWSGGMPRLKLFDLPKCLHAILLWFQLWWVHRKISTLCNETDSPNIFIVGDFNAYPNNNLGEMLSQFCLEHELKISDKIILPVDSFTYVNVSDTHGTCSWLDHAVSSKSAHDSIQNIEILHQFILSDHRPVAATIKTAAIHLKTYSVITS